MCAMPSMKAPAPVPLHPCRKRIETGGGILAGRKTTHARKKGIVGLLLDLGLSIRPRYCSQSMAAPSFLSPPSNPVVALPSSPSHPIRGDARTSRDCWNLLLAFVICIVL